MWCCVKYTDCWTYQGLWYVHSRNIHQTQNRHHLCDLPSQSWVCCTGGAQPCIWTHTYRLEHLHLKTPKRQQLVHNIYTKLHTCLSSLIPRWCLSSIWKQSVSVLFSLAVRIRNSAYYYVALAHPRDIQPLWPQAASSGGLPWFQWTRFWSPLVF